MIRKAVIPAAGFGTRFLPATKAQPKEMLPVVDTPVIQYVVEEAVASGATDILIVIGRGKRAIEEHFDRNLELELQLEARNLQRELAAVRLIARLADLHFVWQRELRGLGDAVACARHHVGQEPFVVLLGDTIIQSASGKPVTRDLIEIFDRHGGPVVALQEVEREKVSRYGVIRGVPCGDGVYRIEELVEKPSVAEAPSNLAISARYALTPDIFDCLDRTPPGKNNEIQLTDAMRLLLETRAMFGYRYDGVRYDVGNKVDFVKTNIAFALQREDMRDELAAYIKQLAAGL